MVINKFEPRLVEFGSGVSLRNGKADSIGESLTKRASGDLDTWCVLSFGMTGSNTVNALGTELVDITDQSEEGSTDSESLQIIQ